MLGAGWDEIVDLATILSTGRNSKLKTENSKLAMGARVR